MEREHVLCYGFWSSATSVARSSQGKRSSYRMCSLSIQCVLFPENVFSYCIYNTGIRSSYRICSLSIECVLLLYIQHRYPLVSGIAAAILMAMQTAGMSVFVASVLVLVLVLVLASVLVLVLVLVLVFVLVFNTSSVRGQ